MDVQAQNEREALLTSINGSAAIMQQIDAQEDIAFAADDRYEKAKKACGLRGILLSCAIAYGFSYTGVHNKNLNSAVILFALIALIVLYWVWALGKRKKLEKINDEEYDKLEALRKDPSLSWLPPHYRTSTAYKAIAGYLLNQRVDTLRDAINLYESEQHNARMEYIAATKA